MPLPKRATALLKSAGRILALLAVLYLPYSGAMAIWKDTFVFPQHGVREAQGRTAPFDARVVQLEAGDGVRIEGWFFPTTGEGRRPSVLFFHGNGELIDHHIDTARIYNQLGWNVLLAEYRGYGRSGGKPSVDHIGQDAAGWHALLCELPEVDAERVVLHGYSLGSAFAAQAARVRAPKGLILVSPFSSLKKMARRNGVWIYFPEEELDTEAVVSSYTGPVLVMHGRMDLIIPFSHGEAVARAAGERAHFEVFDGGHEPAADHDRYWAEIEEFLKKLQAPAS